MKQEQTTTLPFIKTSDYETMSYLMAEGFNLIDFNNGIWTFINCVANMTTFSKETNKNITFSNKLCI